MHIGIHLTPFFSPTDRPPAVARGVDRARLRSASAPETSRGNARWRMPDNRWDRSAPDAQESRRGPNPAPVP
jgi:hypothetical protein